MNKSRRLFSKLIFMLLAFAVAFGLRTYAANHLSIDYDEDDYLRAGQEFAHLIRTDDWRGFLETNYRPEHPQLAKIMFGLSIVNLPEEELIADLPITANPVNSLPPALHAAARRLAALFGALTAMLLAMVNPLGGLILAGHSFTIKYTSQVMLDGFASLMSTCAGLAYFISKNRTDKAKTAFLVASAVFLGAGASSKYLHAAVGFAILIDWFLTARQAGETKRFFRNALLWGILSLIVFAVLNPFYWPNPAERIRATLDAVQTTTTNPNVKRANLPIWEPLAKLSSSVPVAWNEEGFIFRLDGLIFVFAMFGLAETWRKNRFIFIWFVVDLLILLAWQTKWAQYILVATVPLSFIAAEGIKVTGRSIADWWQTRNRLRKDAVKSSTKETRQALPWLVPGLLFFFLLTIVPIVYQFAMSMTTLNGTSLRDGLQGGMMREVLGGVSGQIPIPAEDAELDRSKVHFIGLLNYPGTMNFLSEVEMIFFSYFWTITSVALQAMLGVGAGLLLWRTGGRMRKLWQAIFILPWAIPEAVGALLWMNIFAPFNGWLALAVKKYGAEIPFSGLMGWEKDPDKVLIVMLLAALWYGFPFIMLAVSAGLKMIPRDVFDAAAMDGADSWQTFRYVTWPMLQPLVLPALLVRAIFAFNQFYLFQMFLPYYQNISMTTLSSFSYYVLYGGREFAFSATINIISLVLLSGFVLLLYRRNKPAEDAAYA